MPKIAKFFGRLLAGVGLGERLRRTARDKALAPFTWGAVTDQVERVYRDLAAGQASGSGSARR